MTGPEVGFLVLGLVLGAALGMAITTFRRARPRPTGEVRVTVTTDAIPRRSATLSDVAATNGASPARGGPADHVARFEPGAPERTPVLPAPMPSPARAPGAAGGGMVAVPMGGGVDPLLEALNGARRHPGLAPATKPAVGASAGTQVRPEMLAQAVGTTRGQSGPLDTSHHSRLSATSGPDRPAPAIREDATIGQAGTGITEEDQSASVTTGPCADLRVVATERCEVASRARQEADRAQETLRAAQRSYDDHHSQAEAAAQLADARSVRAAKDAAQTAFRAARSRATSREAVDAAARDWLLEVNRINSEARAANADATRQQEAARALVASIDRLTVEADAARIAAEAADEACLIARQAAADCDEAQLAPPATMPAVPSGAPNVPWLDSASDSSEDEPGALRIGTAPTIFRLLEGDREALGDVVARLAGDDPEQRRAWQLEISNLVDAILGTAIEGAALEFPEEHAFWGPFTTAQSRDIVAALSSLGYRFDGFGGWQDGRIPSQRDLSLALGYAGMDPMRVRHWPTESEMTLLLEPVRVSAPEYLAVAAPDLSLGELVTMLGPRADGLTDAWNAWGRIRPLLLEER